MNIIVKVILLIVAIGILINGFEMLSNPEASFFWRGSCLNCKNSSFGIFLGYLFIFIGLVIFFIVFRKQGTIHSKCPKCENVYNYVDLENGYCPRCNIKTIELEKYYEKK